MWFRQHWLRLKLDLLCKLERAHLVGQDGFGHRYFQSLTSRRRWVIYCGLPEATKVPPLWHMWLHHMRDMPPSDPKEGEAARRPNLTGTPNAYSPPHQEVIKTYKPWSPDEQ